MDRQQSEILILEDEQAPPSGAVTPPRQPKWYDTFNYIANPDKFCRENWQKYGPVFKTGVFGGTTIFVGSAKANQMVFNGDSQYTEISLLPTTMAMFGEYSLFQRPDLHRQRKSALRPGLAGRALEGYLPHINKTILQAIEGWKKHKTIALYPEVEEICFDILVPLLLGINFNDSQEAISELPVSSKSQLKSLYQTFFNGFFSLLKWESPLTAYGRGVKARAKLIEFMSAVISQRRKNIEAIDPSKDFLSMMLASQQENPDGVFSDRLIENQCLLQLWGSHYEISGLFGSIIYQIGQHPQVLDRLREEQSEIRNKHGDVSMLSIEHLQEMTFLEATIKETLRILPPSSTANRKLTRSVVSDGILYEKGCTVIAEPRIAHILPEHFKEPEKFIPDRFLPDSDEGKMYEYIPFGGGVHGCLGAQMAMVIAKLFTSHVLGMFDWKLTGKAQFVQFPIRRIKDNYQIKIKSRV